MIPAKHSRIIRIIFLIIIICIFNFPAKAKYSGGMGEPNDPYLIYTAEQMNTIGLHEEDWGRHFKLMADIDLSAFKEATFNVIGISTYGVGRGDPGEWKPFTGVFDGNNHIISNFTYDSNRINNVALFRLVEGSTAEIKDLGLVDPNVRSEAGRNVGSLIGFLSDGIITNCYVEGGNIEGDESVGGLIGNSYCGRISNCYSSSHVSGGKCIGGLVGTIDSFFAFHAAIPTAILNCYSSSSVSGDNAVGGLVGVITISTFAGGSSPGSPPDQELLPASIQNCYAIGSVKGNARAGGLVGSNLGGITTSYSTGIVEGNESVGGFVGENWGPVYDCFWDTQTSGQTSSAAGEGKTTVELQMASTFFDWGGCGDEPIWTIEEGNDYPRLYWENRLGEILTVPSLSGLLLGSGTTDDPYLIHTPEELNLVAEALCNWDKCFRLVADIDLSDFVYEAALIAPDRDEATYGFQGIPFTGVFDGNGHKISHLMINGKSYLGLFGKIDQGAKITNLGLEVVDVNGIGNYVGGLVGRNSYGSITTSYSTGTITGDYSVGGLVGLNFNGSTAMSYSTATVNGIGSRVGGLVGLNSYGSSITTSYSTSIVTGSGSVGGLVGFSGGTVAMSYSTGSVSSTTTVSSERILYVGHIGGLVGTNAGSVAKSYSTATVNGLANIGGLVGSNEGSIATSYSTGSISGDENVGGLVGRNYGSITMSYSTDSVTGINQVGGLVGLNHNKGGIITCFWDIETSGMSNMCGRQEGKAAGCEDSYGKNTVDIQTASTFLDVGWDFVDEVDNGTDDIWWIDEENDYPRLWWELIPEH